MVKPQPLAQGRASDLDVHQRLKSRGAFAEHGGARRDERDGAAQHRIYIRRNIRMIQQDTMIVLSSERKVCESSDCPCHLAVRSLVLVFQGHEETEDSVRAGSGCRDYLVF